MNRAGAGSGAPPPIESFQSRSVETRHMAHKPDLGSQTADLPLFQGLIESEGRSYSNWGLHRRTIPAVFAEPITYADVQSLVRDDARFPTPVNPVGSIMSVSSTFVNDGGTMVCLRKLDEVIGVERDPAGREVVRVQAGCRLKKLNNGCRRAAAKFHSRRKSAKPASARSLLATPKSPPSMAPAISRRMSGPPPMDTKQP